MSITDSLPGLGPGTGESEPVNHVIQAAFQKFKMNAVYLAFKPQPEALALALEGMRAMGMKGGPAQDIPERPAIHEMRTGRTRQDPALWQGMNRQGI